MSAFKTWLTGLTSKATPVDADELYLRDSVGAASNKLTWVNVKATLKTYFDTLYLALTGGTVAGGTRTTSGSTLTITETLNNAAVTFPGALVVDVTDTASNAASLIADFKAGGATKFNVRKDGQATFTTPTGVVFKVNAVSGSISGNAASTFGTVFVNGDQAAGAASSVSLGGASAEGVTCRSVGFFAFSSSGSNALHTNKDTVLYRDAAGTLAQRNGTNAQTFRNYGTYTDASNYRRVGLTMTTGGVGTLAPEGAGTGASGNCLVLSNGSVTLATLPAASTAGAGARAFVSDASTTLILGLGGTVTGGGANKVPVYSDGTNWIYG